MKTNLLLLACIAGLCDPIFSQVEGDTIRSIDLQQYVISASRDYEPEKLVSQQINIISSTRIKNLQVQTTADALASTPGVFVQKSQMGGGSPVIRGFEASRILLVVDGVRMNNLIYRAGHLQNVITTDNLVLTGEC